MKSIRSIISEEIYFVLGISAILWQVLFLYGPLLIIIGYSFLDLSQGFDISRLTLNYYREIFSIVYFSIMRNSFFIAFLTTLFCLIVGYPIAYFLAMKVRKKYRVFLMFLLILPSWTSFIVQAYSWLFLLGNSSLLSRFLYWTGIISPSTTLLNSRFAIVVGMVAVYLPFMILPIYTSLEKMDKRLLESSADLGANFFQTFKRIIFPLTFSGVLTGSLLVFLPAFNEFAVPALLGGGKLKFWGNLIENKFLLSRDWSSGAVFAIVGILAPIIVIFFIVFLLKIKRIMFMVKTNKEEEDLFYD